MCHRLHPRARTRHGVLPWPLIREGFTFRREQVLVANQPRGIFWPAQLKTGALSVKTSVPRAGRLRRYDDEIGADAPYFRYAYQGDDASNRDNTALRACLRSGLRVIYFYGVAESVYRPFICEVIDEDPAAKVFHVAPVGVESIPMAAERGATSIATTIERRYSIGEVRRRLHQDKFRGAVLGAYERRCAICRLRHVQLLDAAHIIADAERLGEAKVPNGLSLCKLHHAAFDTQLLGVTPDRVVVLRSDLLVERDGPMLEHGLRAFHRQPLVLPRARDDWPDGALLEERWKRFAA
jgi:putative restriction endonuclease